MAPVVREALRSGPWTSDSMVVPKDSMHCFAAAFAVPVASAGLLVGASTVVADDSGLDGCIETEPHRSLLRRPVE